MAALPEGQRQIILLVALEGMRYEEVATILRIPDRDRTLASGSGGGSLPPPSW
jgi:hypothetical protein